MIIIVDNKFKIIFAQTVTHDIEFERAITKHLEIENNFKLELRKLELRHFEIEQHKKNS